MNMRRGAREANEESSRAAQARALGEAVGGLAAFIVAINRLEARLAAVEAALKVRGTGSVPPSANLDSDPAQRSTQGARTDAAGESGGESS